MRASTLLASLTSVIGFGAIVTASPTHVARDKGPGGGDDGNANQQPSVDLGYEIHLGTVNQVSQLYSFTNIRFAQPPVGKLRFQPPVAVPVTNKRDNNNKPVNAGLQTNICPQSDPAWLLVTEENIQGAPLAELEALNAEIQNLTVADLSPAAADENEDCLFLDVLVPEAVFKGKGAPAPVLVWIYGGGYTAGAKSLYNGTGLIAQSQKDGSEGVVFVALNYRLGMFGWLSGPSFQQQGTGNLGLWDQRLALEWVQDNIHLFGGDPKRVTVMGESAGGGSIIHQITAFGGTKGVPFQQAISQSGAWGPLPANAQQEDIWTTTLAAASEVTNSSITTFNQLQALPTTMLQTINKLVVTRSDFGKFTYGPSVDGDFVPALPGLLLLHGQFETSLKLLIGHNSDEGLLFITPFVQTDADFDAYVRDSLPAASDAVIDFLETTLYPPIFDGSFGYTSQDQRAQATLEENAFTCNTRYLAHAFGNTTYNYFFTVPPGLHGQDIAFTFFDGSTALNDGSAVSPAVAHQLQDYITNFVASGNPNVGVAVPHFPQYGSNSTVLDIDAAADAKTMADPLSQIRGRCEWWQLALYA